MAVVVVSVIVMLSGRHCPSCGVAIVLWPSLLWSSWFVAVIAVVVIAMHRVSAAVVVAVNVEPQNNSVCCVSRDLADNRIFFQHPDLIRLLGIHETVMQLMVNTLNKAQQESAATESAMTAIDSTKRSSSLSQMPTEAAVPEPAKVTMQ